MSYLQRKDGSWTAFGDATWNEGDHPRVPEGQAGGGQFTGGAGGGGPTKEPPPTAPSTNAGKKIAAIINSSLSIAAKLAAIKGGNFPINKPESKAYKAAALKWLQEAQQEPGAPQPEPTPAVPQPSHAAPEGSGANPKQAGEMEKVGSQLGSNPGGTYEDPQTHQRSYVKFYANPDQGKVEALAGQVYGTMGIKTTEPEVAIVNGKEGVSTPWRPMKTLGQAGGVDALSDENKKQLAKMFTAAVLTNNWDIVGMGQDNIGIDADGNLRSMDMGGAFNFRAQGAPKTYGTDIDSYHTLLDPKYPAGQVFSKLFKENPHLWETAREPLSALHVSQLFANSGLTNSQSLSKAFDQRRMKLWTLLGEKVAISKVETQAEPGTSVRAKEHLASYHKGMALFAAAKAFDNAYGAEQRKVAPSLRGSWWKDKQAGKEAALAYKGGSGSINSLLRKGPKAAASEATKKHLAQLDSLFYEEGAALKDDVILRRGEGVPQEQIDQMKEELEAGLPCRYQKTGFISTSMAGSSAFAGHSTQFEIVARKGTRVLGLAALPGFKNENEVLMQHGTAFEVLEITKVGHQNVIKMVVL